MTDLRKALPYLEQGALVPIDTKTTTLLLEALRQALAEWTPDDTAYRPDGLSQDSDQLPDATKMIDKDFALNVALEALHNFADDESVDGWKAIDAIGVARKALSEPPVKSYCGGKPNYCEPEMPIDRGAWSDVPDASKWVDELRGDEPEPFLWYSLYVMHETGSNQDAILPFKPHDDGDWIPLYTAPPKRDWVSLTDEEIAQAVGSPIDEVYLSDFRKVEAKLKEKNNG